MGDPHIITTLTKKHAELSGRLQALARETEAVKSALVHVDAVLHLYQHDFDVTAIKPRRTYRRRNNSFSKGNHIRHAMDVLREAKEPLSARDVARLTLERQGVSQPDTKMIEDLRRGLNGSLTHRVKKGSLVVHKDFYPKRFSVSR